MTTTKPDTDIVSRLYEMAEQHETNGYYDKDEVQLLRDAAYKIESLRGTLANVEADALKLARHANQAASQT